MNYSKLVTQLKFQTFQLPVLSSQLLYLVVIIYSIFANIITIIAQSAEAVEYTAFLAVE